MFVSLDIFVWAPEAFLCTEYHSSESLTEAPDLVAGLWRPLYVEWRNYAINYCPVHLLCHQLVRKLSSRIQNRELPGLSRICLEMTRQATMPSSSEKCLGVSKTESYGLSRICFEMTRQATMPSSSPSPCLADEQHIC
jgi:hypothetical protein